MAKRNAQNERLTEVEIPRFRRGNSQLLGKVLQDIGLNIVRPGWKSRPFPEEAQLKRKPDPARTIDLLDQSDVIKGQAPNLDKRPFQLVIPPNNARYSLTLSTCPVNARSFMIRSLKCPYMHARAC